MQPLELRADCQRCLGLCCVALTFGVSADFPIDKPAGEPCRNLAADFRCRIHAHLRQHGFRGCSVYDCFGAGQHVSQVTFAGASWRQDPGLAQQMFAVFAVMRRLHELLWHVAEARQLPVAQEFGEELRLAFDETSDLTRRDAKALLVLDLTPHWQKVNALLQRVSQAAQASVNRPGPDYRGADLAGADLRRADLRGANLRGACLIRADLSNARLALADVTGADLRDAVLRGADLGDSLFLTQAQLDAAIGNRETRIPAARLRPPHWE